MSPLLAQDFIPQPTRSHMWFTEKGIFETSYHSSALVIIEALGGLESLYFLENLGKKPIVGVIVCE